MHAQNTAASYGTIARAFHWLTALLILTLLPLGFVAENWPTATPDEVAFKVQLFSWHKTLGVATFFVAILRVLWAISQRHPAALHPERKVETFAATLVHWLLYGALIIVPASGWLYHATTTGFAPILWPFGQDLPMIPKSESLGLVFKTVHGIGVFVLIGSLLAHIAGALKHAVIDRDATLARMTHGRAALPSSNQPTLYALPAVVAAVAWAVVIFAAWSSEPLRAEPPVPAATTAAPSTAPASAADSAAQTAPNGSANWLVESGQIAISVQQMGSSVGGSFPEWAAQIQFDETPNAEGVYGTLDVVINTAAITLGSVSDQAKGAEFFDAATHPTAQFLATIRKAEGAGYLATGTLTLRGETVPVDLPFTLEIDGDTAKVTAHTSLDRRDFKIGQSYADEKTVGFNTAVEIELTAKRVTP